MSGIPRQRFGGNQFCKGEISALLNTDGSEGPIRVTRNRRKKDIAV
jgi:hypothetical protein